MDIQELLARAEIEDVIMRYCRGVDRGHLDILQALHHDDSYEAHGRYEGPARGFGPYVIEFTDALKHPGQHHITSVIIDMTGTDSANAESYYLAIQPYRPDANSQREELAICGGRYLDRFERRDGRWAIIDRRVVMDWSRGSIPGEEWSVQQDYPRGDRRERDPNRIFASATNSDS